MTYPLSDSQSKDPASTTARQCFLFVDLGGVYVVLLMNANPTIHQTSRWGERVFPCAIPIADRERPQVRPVRTVVVGTKSTKTDPSHRPPLVCVFSVRPGEEVGLFSIR